MRTSLPGRIEDVDMAVSDAYRQLFPKGESSEPYRPAEDGDHYTAVPDFFEWWYFDVALDDGSHLVAVLHSSLYNVADHKPTVDLRYYPRRGQPVVAIGRYRRSDYRAASDRCQVQIAACQVEDLGDRYRLSLLEGPLAAELTFWPRLSGWRAGTGHLFFDPDTGRYFDWIVPLPRAHVEGVLSVRGESRPVVGQGYHDHNWGNLYLPAAFRGWTWGRAQLGAWTVIFGDVVGRGEPAPHVTPFYLARDDTVLLSTDRIQVQAETWLREPRTGARYPRVLTVQTLEGPTVTQTLTARRALEALHFAAPRLRLTRLPRGRGLTELAYYLAQPLPGLGPWIGRLLGRATYLRWLADGHLISPDLKVHAYGEMLYEVMIL